MMRKTNNKFKNIKLLVMIAAILLLISCANTKQEDETVRIWYYEYEGSDGYATVSEKAIEYIERFAEINEIEIEVVKYSYKDLSNNDYILKRNSAIEHGDADIILDNMYSLYPIRKHAGDYSKLDNYENITGHFGEGFCVPIAYSLNAIFVDNELIDKYGVNTDKVIMVEDYYRMKQEMKEKGAKFSLNGTELHELINYYILKNNVKIYRENGMLTVDKDIMVNTINEILEDMDKYYENNEIKVNSENDYLVYDMNYGKNLTYITSLPAMNTESYRGEPIIENYTIAISNEEHTRTASVNELSWLFISKNSGNDNVYKIADSLFGDGFQCIVYDEGFGVISNSEFVRNYIGFERNGNYTGKKSVDANGDIIRINRYYDKNSEERLFEMMEKSYESLRKMTSDNIYTDNFLKPDLRGFIVHYILDGKDGAGENDLSTSIDEFITNLNIRYN